MEEDKKSTAVQPEEAPKPKPRRRKAASPQPAADTPPAPTDSAAPPETADGLTWESVETGIAGVYGWRRTS